MLNNATQGEKIGIEGDVYDQVAGACRGARPRIQKWIEDDNGEREGMMGEVAKTHYIESQLMSIKIDCYCATI